MLCASLPRRCARHGALPRRLGRARRSAVPHPPEPETPWRHTKLRHVVDSKEFQRECLELVFEVAEEMEKVKPGSPESKQLEGYCMATLFYEPSTRTRLSFEAAMGKLGGVILSTESAGQFSSAAKGETLEGARRPACVSHGAALMPEVSPFVSDCAAPPQRHYACGSSATAVRHLQTR